MVLVDREPPVVDDYFTKSEYGEDWPFKIDSVRVDCWGYNEVVLITTWGDFYGINGVARGTGKYLDVFDIWKDNPKDPSTKIPLDEILSYGLSKCD